MVCALTKILDDVTSVAVVGASPKRGKVGNVILRNIISYGFKGKVYPVNPKYSEILGLKTYPSIKQLPETPDIVIVAVPASFVPELLKESIDKGVKLAVIVSSGFREIGNEEAENELERIAGSGSIRLMGPNSAGLTVTKRNLHASIEVLPERGGVGLAMQSGAMGGVVISRLKDLSSGVSFFLSVGNAVDVGVEDAFEYALEDENTESLIAYVEWVKHGRRFIKTGMELSKRKPVCILKGGRGEKSLRAVASHTGGLAGDYEVFVAAAKKIGAYLADDVDDLVEVCEVLRRIESFNARRVLIVSNSGGLAVVTASHMEVAGVDIPEIPNHVRELLASVAGKSFTGRNPIDFGGDSFMDQVIKAFTAEGLEKYFDLGILVYVPTAAERPRDMVSAIEEVIDQTRIPVIAYFDGEGASVVSKEVSKVLPVVSSAMNVAKAVKALTQRHIFLTTLSG